MNVFLSAMLLAKEALSRIAGAPLLHRIGWPGKKKKKKVYTKPTLVDYVIPRRPGGIMQPVRMLKWQVPVQEFFLYRESSPPPVFGVLVQVFAQKS